MLTYEYVPLLVSNEFVKQIEIVYFWQMAFSVQEIEHLQQLLLSEDDNNKLIALGLVENSPSIVPKVQVALCITAYLSKYNRASIESVAHDLLVNNLTEAAVTELQNEIIILNYAQYKFKVTEGWNTYQNPLRNFLKIHEAAIDNYYRLFQFNPAPYSKLYSILASRIQKEWKNPSKALFFYKKAIALDSNNTQAQFGFALIVHVYYIQKGKCLDMVDQVLQYYMNAYKGPKNIVAYKNAAMLCKDIGNLDRAEAYYKAGLEHCPDDSALLNNYAYLLMEEKKDFVQAKVLAERGLESAPFDAALLDTLAHIEFIGFQNYKRAEGLFKKALKKDELHHYSHTGLGDMYVAMGNYTLAEEHYKKGLHDGLQYTSREVSEVLEKLEKMIDFYTNHLKQLPKADFYKQKRSRLL